MGNCSYTCWAKENLQPQFINKADIENMLVSQTSLKLERIKSKNTPLYSSDSFTEAPNPLQFSTFLKNQKKLSMISDSSSILSEHKISQLEENETSPNQTTRPVQFSNGSIYIGDWKNSKRHGFGVQTWPDGARYEGAWKDDSANGFGKLLYPNGDLYEGDWLNDKANGTGTYFFVNGSVYKGEWNDDKRHGKGEEVWMDGKKYEGDFVENNKEGKGKLTISENSYYEGDFLKNEFDGYGVLVTEDKRKEGNWAQSKMTGKGKIIWNDGKVFEGDFDNDEINGFGIYDWNDDRVLIGHWAKGKIDGYGVLVFKKKGKIGKWENGKRIEWVNLIENAGHLDDLIGKFEKWKNENEKNVSLV